MDSIDKKLFVIPVFQNSHNISTFQRRQLTLRKTSILLPRDSNIAFRFDLYNLLTFKFEIVIFFTNLIDNNFSSLQYFELVFSTGESWL